MSGALTLQLVQPVTGQAHSGWPYTPVQRGEQPAQPGRVLCVDPSGIAAEKKPLDSLVAKPPDHSANCNLSGYKVKPVKAGYSRTRLVQLAAAHRLNLDFAFVLAGLREARLCLLG